MAITAGYTSYKHLLMKNVFLFLTAMTCLSSFSVFSQNVVWQEEAEDGIILGTAEILTNRQYASGPEKAIVKINSDSGNGIAFENINISKAGSYQLRVYYFHTGEQPLEIVVNNQSIGVIYFPAANWAYQGPPAEQIVNIELLEGLNQIKLMAVAGIDAPYIDYVTITTHPSHEGIDLNLAANIKNIVKGQELKITVHASDPVNEDISVELMAEGLEGSAYKMDPPLLTIPKGNSKGQVIFKTMKDAIDSDQTVLIKMNIVSGDVLPGIDSTITVAIYNQNTTWYISSSEGNDTNSGSDASHAWESLEQVSASSFLPGDSVLFKAGDSFVGQLVINSSGLSNHPITYSRYGEGKHPVINGSTAPGGDHLCAIFINNQDNIRLKGLKITNDRRVSRVGVDDTDAFGILVLNDGGEVMQGFHFDDLIIREVYALHLDGVPFNSIIVSGILLQSERNLAQGKEKHIRDVLIENCYVTRTARLGMLSRHQGGVAGVGNDSINRNMNLVFRNNHFFELGGTGILPSHSYNTLLEYNTFEYSGSDVDPRMAARGSGAWFFNTRNVVAQFNRSLHIRGPGDSYGMHIDYNNKNVFLQYNYSEDSEGGFVEILGDNVNCGYRFNVSVNDGFRHNGRSLWVSEYAGSNRNIASDSNYVYNNTIYLGAGFSTDILIVGENTFVYNNIFFSENLSTIGKDVTVTMRPGSHLRVANNLYYGDVSSAFTNRDTAPHFGDPLFEDTGALHPDAYALKQNSLALNTGKIFDEPPFPMAGKGIFKDMVAFPLHEMFVNGESVHKEIPNIGAFNGLPSGQTSTGQLPSSIENHLNIFPNPVYNILNVEYRASAPGTSQIEIKDSKGKVYYSTTNDLGEGINRFQIPVDTSMPNGFYLITIKEGNTRISRRFVVVN